MTDQVYDPTQDQGSLAPQDPQFGKTRFGQFAVLSLKGDYLKDSVTNLRGFTITENGQEVYVPLKGFKPGAGQKQAVIVANRVTKLDGGQFIAYKVVTTDSKPYHEIVFPGLTAVFGDISRVPLGSWFYAQAEEIEFGKENANGKKNTAYKIVATFKTEAEMKAASDEFWASRGGSSTPASAENPYEALGLKAPGIWAGQEEAYWKSIPEIMKTLAGATPAPLPLFQNQEPVKKVMAYGLSAEEVAHMFANADAINAISPF